MKLKLTKIVNYISYAFKVYETFKAGQINDRLPMQKVKDRSLSIILNGPSVNHTIQYLDTTNSDVMMVNKAVESELYSQINPKYYCLADPFFFKKNKQNYQMLKKINKDTIVFCPNNQNIDTRQWKFKVKNVLSIYSDNIEDLNVKLFEKNLIAPYFINVGIMALYVGIQMGYKKIYVYGLDFDMYKWVGVDKDNKVYYEHKHFYEEGVEARIYPKVKIDMTYEMKTQYETFAGFKVISKYAKKENVKIINMSNESMVDCFERFR